MSKDDEQKKVTPRLRFPEFRGNAFHDLRLGDVSASYSKRNGETLEASSVMGVFKGEGMLPMEERLKAKDISRYKVVKRDYFAYNPMRLNIGSIARWHGDEDVLVSPDYVVFRCDKNNDTQLDPAYLDHFRESDQWDEFVTLSGDGSVRVRIYYKDLATMRLRLPAIPEQRKIAACLGSLDDWIAAEARALAALRRHKTGLMQQLFPRPGQTRPRLRFPEFQDAGAWDETKLDELTKRGTGHTPDKKKPEYYNGGISWVSLTDSHRLDNGLIKETNKTISEAGLANSSAVLHPEGTVILSRDAGVGKSAITGKEMAVSQHFIVWRCKPDRLSNWFLYYLLQRLKPMFEQIATGSTIKTIGVPFFKAMKVIVPEPAEQRRIADCLAALDARLSAQAEKLAALRRHKRGLMQQLFPLPEGR